MVRPTDGARVVTMPVEEERQATDQVGMIVFLGSWAMMFGALFFSLVILRLRLPSWPPPGMSLPLLLPAVATGIMACSEVLLGWTLAGLRRGRWSALVPGLAGTLALGAAFLAVQGVTWATLWKAGLRPSGGPIASMLYAFTAFHALHVLVGLGLLAGLLPAGARHEYDVRRQARLRLAGMFWHFVGIVWVLNVLAIYVA